MIAAFAGVVGSVAAGGVGSGVDGVPFQDIGFAGLLGIVVWWLVRRVDRDDEASANEIVRLRQQLDDERSAHQTAMDALRQEHAQSFSAEQEAVRAELANMREWMNEQIEAERAITAQKSSEKHAVANRLAFAAGTLDAVAGLAPSCTCGSLDGVAPLLERWRVRRAEEHARD